MKFDTHHCQRLIVMLRGPLIRLPALAVRHCVVALTLVAPAVASESLCGDVDCSLTVRATDALMVLKTAVGTDVGLQCTCPTTTTTTTLASGCASVDRDGFADRLAAARCVAYSPSGDWNPNTGNYPSSQSVATDLALLHDSGFDCIVTYGADHVLAEVPCMARQAGFELVVMGVWNPASTQEHAGATAAADCADAYSVGNEGISLPYGSGLSYSWDELAAAMANLRAETCHPVTTSEPSGAYLDGVAGHTADEVRHLGDWVFANAHPYFAGKKGAADAVAWTIDRYHALVEADSDRFVMLKEVGLPSAGDTDLSEDNQRVYYAALTQTATRFAVFEAFDQVWKQSLAVEPHWGIFGSDRTPKPAAGAFAGS